MIALLIIFIVVAILVILTGIFITVLMNIKKEKYTCTGIVGKSGTRVFR